MGRKLARTVTVDGKQYRAGSTPPADIADKIRTGSAWGADEATASEEPQGDGQDGGGDGDPAAGSQPQGGEDVGDEPQGEDEDDEASSDADPLEEPPRRGRGATDAAWRKHAQALGVEVDDDTGRDDVQALLVERGLIDPA